MVFEAYMCKVQYKKQLSQFGSFEMVKKETLVRGFEEALR